MYFKGTLGVKENSRELDAAELSDSEEESQESFEKILKEEKKLRLI